MGKNDRAQVSLEYLIMLSLVIIVATIALVLTTRILLMEETIRDTIIQYREQFLGITN